MAVNKIVLNTDDGEQVLVDLTGDSVSEGTLFEGETAHAANGEKIVGTFTLESEMSEQDTLIEQIKTALEGKASVDITDNGVVEVTPNSYNAELQQNNTELQSILAAVNALPEAGGGQSVETCTLTVSSWNNINYIQAVILVNGHFALYNSLVDGRVDSIEVVKNTLCLVYAASPRYSLRVGPSGNFLITTDTTQPAGIYITGDITVAVQ